MFLRYEIRLGEPRKCKNGKLGKRREKKVGILVCDHCRKQFERYVQNRDLNRKHFCSPGCKRDAKKPGGCMYLANGGFQTETRVLLSDREACQRTKLCAGCGQEFIDESKSGRKNCCSRKCQNLKMIRTRRDNDSYERTDEQNAKLSATLKKKYEDGWNPNTPEHREKLSHSMRERWSSGAMARMTRATCQEKYGVNHWTQCHDWESHPSIWKGGFREDLGRYFRSSWEANFARYLSFENRIWKYEPQRFFFSDGTSYLPDFLVDDTWIEIKGWMSKEGQRKIDMFHKEFSHLRFELVDGVKYKQLELEYKELITTWE